MGWRIYVWNITQFVPVTSLWKRGRFPHLQKLDTGSCFSAFCFNLSSWWIHWTSIIFKKLKKQFPWTFLSGVRKFSIIWNVSESNRHNFLKLSFAQPVFKYNSSHKTYDKRAFFRCIVAMVTCYVIKMTTTGPPMKVRLHKLTRFLSELL